MIDELQWALDNRKKKKEELYLSYLELLKAIMTINPYIKTVDINILLTDGGQDKGLYPYDYKILGFNSISFESTSYTNEVLQSYLLNINLKHIDYIQVRQKILTDIQTVQFIYKLSGKGLGLKDVPRQMLNIDLALIEEMINKYKETNEN